LKVKIFFVISFDVVLVPASANDENPFNFNKLSKHFSRTKQEIV